MIKIFPFFLGGEAHSKKVPSSLMDLKTIIFPVYKKPFGFMGVPYNLHAFIGEYGVTTYAYVHHNIPTQEALFLYHDALYPL
jgi:hypothetical protein